ncbi:Amylo-alpha-1,6-glucosidase [uncultured archaeon]|nr:Amylo-alpha-1,6-glucosidase [uncultured archaeon]
MAIFPPEQERLERATGLEWWLGNAQGGWASASASGALTRKYHALLSVAFPAAGSRRILLGKFEETALAGGIGHPLSTNFYPDTVHPAGWKNIERFLFDGAVARWTYGVAGRRLAKEVWCDRARPATYVRYTLLEGEPLGLEVVPLVSGRHAHSLGLPEFMRRHPGGTAQTSEVRWLSPMPWGIQASGGLFRPKADVYYRMRYPRERERGEADEEDWATPGRFEFLLREGQQVTLRAWAQTDAAEKGKEDQTHNTYSDSAPALDSLGDSEAASRRLGRVVEEFRDYNAWGEIPWLENLLRASDSLFVREGERFNVIAGYPYFGVWARDALISVPGLCLYTGRHSLGRDILMNWTGRLQGGLLPNRYDEDGKPAFESADGTLWLFWAMSQLQSEGGMTPEYLKSVWPALRGALHAWMKGTRFGRVDKDGLVSLKEERLTWMDAAKWVEEESGGTGPGSLRAITPRPGKRVEINALWIHALDSAAKWAAVMGEGEEEERFFEAVRLARGSFGAFYHEPGAYLQDGIQPADAAVRANQLWAIALPSVQLGQVPARRALGTLVDALWAEGCGVRTLSHADENYHPNFTGEQGARDEAYHQGAAWPWLSGVWTEAWLRHYPKRAEELHRQVMSVAAQRLPGTLLGAAEIHDPSTGADGGCPLQAWSVAELIRAGVMVERTRRWHSASAILSPSLEEITAPMRPKKKG